MLNYFVKVFAKKGGIKKKECFLCRSFLNWQLSVIMTKYK